MPITLIGILDNYVYVLSVAQASIGVHLAGTFREPNDHSRIGGLVVFIDKDWPSRSACPPFQDFRHLVGIRSP